MQIVKFVRKNGVGLVYVDSKKVGSMVTSLRKLHDKELEECVVRPKGGKLFGFRQMISEEMREAKALQVVTGILRCHVARLRFKAWKKRLQISKTICRWARNTILIKAVRRGIKAMRETTDAKFLAMQQAFRK